MTFLNPWAIWLGLAAAGLPAAIHWLTRPRPVRLPLSTLRFVREAVHEKRSRHRLRDFILLALRTLAILLIALALARPQWGEKPLISNRLPGDTVRVVLVDVSQSMGAVDRGVQALDRARTAAADYLRYQQGLSANVIFAAADARGIFDGPSTNFEALREGLSRIRALPQRLDVNRALEAAGQMLAPLSPEDHRRRELVVLSDFQRSNWAKADFSRLPDVVITQLESVAPTVAPPNLAVLRASARTLGAQAGTAQVEVTLGNFTSTQQRVDLEITLGETTLNRKVLCPASRETQVVEEVQIKPGWQSGRVKLSAGDDALAADDVRPLVLRMRPQAVYALLSRQPAHKKNSSSHYLEIALAPEGKEGEPFSGAEGDSPIFPAGKSGQSPALGESSGAKRQTPKVIRLDPQRLDAAAAAQADLIVVDHPGKLAGEQIGLLADLLRRGRPILYVAAETVDATNLKRLTDAAGAGARMPVEFSPPTSGHRRKNLFLASVRKEDAPFSAFGDTVGSIIAPLRFGGGLNSRRIEQALDEEIPAAYNDGSACLVYGSTSGGALAVLNADLSDSNLPKSNCFVPLLGELIARLMEKKTAQATAYCGEPLVAYLPEDVGPPGGLRIEPPAERGSHDGESCGELIAEAGGTVWRWLKPDRPGVYRAQRGAETVFALPVEFPPEESDLEALPPNVLQGRLASGHTVYYRQAGADNQRQDDAWKWFGFACVLCLLGEVAVIIGFKT
jgi:hypothetical protein